MINPVVIQVSPEKPNLYFSVKENVAGSITAVISELKHKRVNMERMIIFCRRPLDCANLWMQFHALLGTDITQPPGSSIKNPELRLVDYFTGCTEEAVRDAILKQFSKESCLRVSLVQHLEQRYVLSVPALRAWCMSSTVGLDTPLSSVWRTFSIK